MAANSLTFFFFFSVCVQNWYLTDVDILGLINILWFMMWITKVQETLWVGCIFLMYVCHYHVYVMWLYNSHIHKLGIKIIYLSVYLSIVC